MKMIAIAGAIIGAVVGYIALSEWEYRKALRKRLEKEKKENGLTGWGRKL